MLSTPFDDEIERDRRQADRGSVDAMNRLARRLRDRYFRTGDPADLVEGVEQLRTAIGYVSDDRFKLTLMINLSALQLELFNVVGDLPELREVIGRLDEVIPLVRGESRFAATLMRAEALIQRGEHVRDPGDVDDAIESVRRLRRWPDAEFVLGRALHVRYTLTADPSALFEAVDVLEECVRSTPADDPNRLLRHSELGSALQSSAEHTGDESVREAAVRHLRRAVTRASSMPTRLLDLKVDLAAALRERGYYTGDVSALRECATLLSDVLEATEPGTRSWVNRCENYMVAVSELVQRTGDVDLMDRALEIGRSVRGRGSKDATIPMLLGRLHHQRFLRTRAQSDLLEALVTFTDVVESLDYGDRDHVSALGNMGLVWFSAYEFSREPLALDSAMAALGSAARGSVPDSPLRGQSQIAFGNALYAQYELSRDPGALASAGYAYREAAQNASVAPALRIRAARAWARTEAEADNWCEARDAHAFAVDLLPLVAPRRLARVDQQRLLAEFDGLAANAAASALCADDPETAVRVLELGRGVLGGQVLQSRSDLSRLRAVAPELARRLGDAFRRLIPSEPVLGGRADSRHGLDIRLQELLDEARRLPGFADFLAQPDLADLLTCAADGPVVLINVSGYRSDALIVRPSGITVVELPGVTPDSVAEQAAAFGAALTASTRPGSGEAEAQTTVTEVLAWLWDEIADPVLARLGHTCTPSGDWPRVWWSPVGRLALLPLHAAGRDQGTTTVLDRVVSAYTPTLRALRHARARPTRADGDLLVVAIGDADGAKALRGVGREANSIAALTPATRLDGAQATVDSVRAALTSHPSAHFACHASSDPDDPSAGHLLLHDGPLSVLDVSALDLPGARLAVLSACQTSLGAHRIPDEGLHLVSAFQLAGYSQVVGTLWQINDLVARRVAVDLHEGVHAGKDVALALHGAVRRCRERFSGTPTLWASYLYSGK